MKVLEGVLSESKDYYIDAKKSIERKLSSLPGGSVKERIIKGKKYYYHQQRRGKRVVHKYIGKEEPEGLLKQIKERKTLKVELKKVNEALRLLEKIGNKKHG